MKKEKMIDKWLVEDWLKNEKRGISDTKRTMSCVHTQSIYLWTVGGPGESPHWHEEEKQTGTLAHNLQPPLLCHTARMAL